MVFYSSIKQKFPLLALRQALSGLIRPGLLRRGIYAAELVCTAFFFIYGGHGN